MAFEIETYSPSEIILQISEYQIAGFDKISVSRNSPEFKIMKGIRGINSRKRNRDSSCTITIDIIQTSIANDVLSEILNRDLQTNSARLTLSLTDGLGSSKIVSNDCFIEGYPEVVYSDDIQFRRWRLICLSTDIFNVGGNAKLNGNVFNDTIGGVSSSIYQNIT